MRGISTVIASILMLMIVIALGGTTYLYISGVYTSKISATFELIDSVNDSVTIRNDGTEPIVSFSSVSIDGVSAVYRVSTRDPSLVGYWKMDEGSWTNDCLTNTVMDSSGNENRGKSCPIGTGPIGGAVGKFGNAGNFDGIDDYVDVGGSSVLKINGPITIGLWAYWAGSGDQVLYSNVNGAVVMGIHIRTSSTNTLEVYYNYNGAYWYSSTTSFLPNQWNHVAFTFDTSTNVIKLYLNGVQVSSSGSSNAYPRGVTNTHIGKRADLNSVYFKGIIDEVNVYNRALSAQEVNAHYNIGSQINSGEIATMKIYNSLTKGTHTLRLCTSSTCNTAYLTIQ